MLYDTAHILMLDCNVDVFVFVWAKEKKKMAANRAMSLEETKNETIDFISAFFYFLLFFYNFFLGSEIKNVGLVENCFIELIT